MPVGKIYDYRFNKENKVEIDVVIDKAFAHFVKKDSRFWISVVLMPALMHQA